MLALTAAGALSLAALAAAPGALAAEAEQPATSANWLEGYFNNVAIGDSGSTAANFDGLGYYFLRDSQGALPTNTPLTIDGEGGTELSYTLAGGTEGAADNISIAPEDTFTIDNTSLGLGSLASTKATQIRLIGAGSGGTTEARVTLNYASDNNDETSDSSTETSVNLFDWCSPGGTTDSTSITNKWNRSGDNLGCGLSATKTLHVDEGRAVDSITVKVPVQNSSWRFHIFAIASDAVVDTDAITLKSTSGAATIGNIPEGNKYSDSMESLTASNTVAWSQAPDSVTYVWRVAGKTVQVGPSDSYAFRAADAGKSIVVSAVAKKKGYVSGAVTSDSVTIAKGDFTSTTDPQLGGTARVGDQLTATPGAVTPTGATVSYAWFADGQEIAGASASSLLLSANELGKKISVKVTYSKAGFNDLTAQASIDDPVAKGTITTTTQPSIAGSFTTGSQLTASAGSYSPTGVTESHQWLADGEEIAGATASTYTVTPNDVNKTIGLRVTASRDGFEDAVATVSGEEVTKADLAATADPTVSTNPAFGSEVVVLPGTYVPESAVESYEWLLDGTPIENAAGAQYTPSTQDIGKVLSVRVTAAADGYNAYARELVSGKIALAELAVTVAPSLTPKSGVIGTAARVVPGTYAAGSDGAAAVQLSYQWSVDGADIPKATTATYTPVAADLGKTLRVVVTATLPGYADSVTTLEAGKVSRGALVAAKAPAITGSVVRVGQAVKATPGTYNVAGASYTYQWLRNGAAISKATGATYTPVAADYRAGLAVRVTATLNGYASVTTVSAQRTVGIGIISVKKKASLKVGKKKAIKKKIKAGKKVKVVKPKLSTGGVKLTYRWYVGKKKVSGKKGAKKTYKVTRKDVKKKLFVKITLKKSGYKTVTIKTAKTGKVKR
ncbi:hypothetical protein GCM10010407_01650 [Rarobacter incanus]